jgi:hypothetical protein
MGTTMKQKVFETLAEMEETFARRGIPLIASDFRSAIDCKKRCSELDLSKGATNHRLWDWADIPARSSFRLCSPLRSYPETGHFSDMPTYSRAKELAQQGRYQQSSVAAAVEKLSLAVFDLIPPLDSRGCRESRRLAVTSNAD